MSDRRMIGRVTMTLVLAGTLMGALGACGTSGSRAGSAQEGIYESELEKDPYYRSGYRLVWRSFPQVNPGQRPMIVQRVGDAIAFQDTANTLSMVEDATGRIRWAASMGKPIEKFVGVDRVGDRLLVASESELQFLDISNGQLLDRQRLSVLANTPPVVIPPTAVIGSSTGEVYGHDIRVGVRVWGVQMNGPISSPVIRLGGDDIGVVSQGGQIIMLDSQEGTSAGRRATLFSGISNRAITDGAQMYVAGLDQSVWAYDNQTGQRAWRFRTQSRLDAQPLVADGVVVVYAEREGLLGIDARTGAEFWAQPEAKGDAVGAHRGEAALWDGTTLSIVSLRDGSIRSQETLPGIDRLIAGDKGVMYGVDINGVISKYEPLS